MGVRLNAVMPVLGDKRSNPWKIVTIEHGLLGTAYDQTIELFNLIVAKFKATATKVCEREV